MRQRKQFENDIKRDPNETAAYRNWGMMLSDQGDDEESTKKYEMAISLYEANNDAYVGLARLLEKQKSYS